MNQPLHSLLKRQMKRLFGESSDMPSEWQSFIDMVNNAYHEFDNDRYILERSLDLSSQELLQANSELRAIFDAIPDLFFRLDDSGTILDCEAGNTSDLFIAKERLIGRKVFEIPVEEVSKKLKAAIEQVHETMAVLSVEYSISIQNNVNSYEARLLPFLKSQIIMIIRNVTEQKNAESSLRASEEKYRSIFENSVEGIFRSTPEGAYISVNPAFARMHGYQSPEDMLGAIYDVRRQFYADPYESSKIKELLTQNGFVKNYEAQRLKTDGTTFWTSMNAHVVRDGSGKIIYREGTIQNINERKIIEDLLKKEKETFFSILQKAPYGVVLADENGKYLYINPEYTTITGYTLEDVPTGRDWFLKAYPNEKELKAIKKQWHENIALGGHLRIFKVCCKNGTIKDIEFRPTKLDDGSTITMLSDITERQQAEELFKTLANNSPVGVYIMQNGRFKYTNTYCHAITGYSEAELIDRDSSEFIFSDDLLQVRSNTIATLRGDCNAACELRVVTKGGNIKYILQSITYIQYKDSRALLGSFIDISNIKKIENELKESEERYRILTEESLVGVYLIQEGVFQYVNPAFAEIHGYDPDEIIGKLGPRDLTIQEDWENITNGSEIKAGREMKNNIYFEIRMRRKDGTIRHIEVYGSNVIYKEKKAVLGTALDITEKRQIEEKLKAMSLMDELTGLYNRRGFFTVSEQQIKMAKRLNKELLLFFVDIDGMKWINDNLGHKEGDKTLLGATKVLRDTFRDSDAIGRLGGDEFAVLAVTEDSRSPDVMIERLNNNVVSYNLCFDNQHKLSLSAGAAICNPEEHVSLDDLISYADKLMYDEKKRKGAQRR